MSYLLDSNACIRILNGSDPLLIERFRSHHPKELRVCSIVKAELYFGARNSGRVQENLLLLDRFFAPLLSLPFDDAAALEYGRIRAELQRQGNLIGPNDLCIASIARALDLVLITHNQREFSRVSGLRLEDWELPG